MRFNWSNSRFPVYGESFWDSRGHEPTSCTVKPAFDLWQVAEGVVLNHYHQTLDECRAQIAINKAKKSLVRLKVGYMLELTK